MTRKLSRCAFAFALILSIQHASAAAATKDPGETLFKENCAQCHLNKVPRAPDLEYLQMMMPQHIYKTLTEGAMRPQASRLKDADKRLIAEWLSGRKFTDVGHGRPPVKCQEPARFDRSSPITVGSWGIDLENSRRTPREMARLSVEDVKRLKLKWAFSFSDAQRARSQPTVAGGLLFVGGQSGEVHALDPKSGCQHWVFQATGEVRTAITIDQTPALYFGDIFGNVYSIDAGNGALRWKVKVDDHPAATITGSPVVHAGRVYVPLSAMEDVELSGCCTNRGAVAAYDASTGRLIWKTYTIPNAPVEQRSEGGSPQFGPAGASVMSTPTIDVKRGVLYIGTGQNHGVVTDTNSDSLVAMSLADGRVVWRTQVTPRDVWPASPFRAKNDQDVHWDFDFSASPILVHGAGRDILVAGQKSGEAFGVNPDNGAILWRNKLGRGGVPGGIHFSIAQDDDIIIVPMHDSDYLLEDVMPAYTEPAQPGINAVDAWTGKTLWRKPVATYCGRTTGCHGISAAITTIPGVVFAGGRDGDFEAFATRSGEMLWSFNTNQTYTALNGDRAHGGSIGGAGPLIADGMVFINSGYGIYDGGPGNVLLAFSVDGR